MRAFLLISAMTMCVTAFAGTQEKFKLITAGELAEQIDKKEPALVVFDVNGEKTRKADGVIPGAKLLPSTKYDIAQELPADKNAKLVFYCANLKCMASHSAAERAVEAGYSHVSVMKDGIEGWKKSGHPIQKFGS